MSNGDIMSTIKLTYFDMPGGRAEPARIVLTAGKIPFEDHRISFEEFGKTRSSLPLSAVPIVEIDGTVYTQSNAMNRYFGKLTGYYPDDPWEAFKCDEVMGVTEDVLNKIVQTFGLKDEKLKAARKVLADETITRYVKLLDTRLAAAGGQYFADHRLTVGDLKVFIQLRSLSMGVLDHVPSDIVTSIAPAVQDYADRIAKEPIVINYYSA